MFGFSTDERVKTARNKHFMNIPVDIWVQSPNVYSFKMCMAKLVTEGKGWWKSVQCLCMADVVDLACPLALSSREHEVSPI